MPNSPQLENGHVRIANEILDALIIFNLPSAELRCVLFVIRKTYGFNKKYDWISNSQFVLGTGLHKSNVCRAIRKLVERKIVVKDDNKKQPCYRLNKKYWEWKQLSPVTTTPKKKLLSNTQLAVVTSDNNESVVTGDNKKEASDCSSEENSKSKQLSNSRLQKKPLLSNSRPTKDSNNFTKDRGNLKNEKKGKKLSQKAVFAKMKILSSIVAGNQNHTIVGNYGHIGETFPEMQVRAKRELENLRREINE